MVYEHENFGEYPENIHFLVLNLKKKKKNVLNRPKCAIENQPRVCANKSPDENNFAQANQLGKASRRAIGNEKARAKPARERDCGSINAPRFIPGTTLSGSNKGNSNRGRKREGESSFEHPHAPTFFLLSSRRLIRVFHTLQPGEWKD